MADADMVFYNGQVFTAEASQPRAQAIAVDDGRILQVGSDAAILALVTPPPSASTWLARC